mgnify:CR=1 FL=1
MLDDLNYGHSPLLGVISSIIVEKMDQKQHDLKTIGMIFEFLSNMVNDNICAKKVLRETCLLDSIRFLIET